MWKFVARGIRETLERRVCRTNVYSQSSQDNATNEIKTNLTRQQKFLPPVFVTCDKGFCGSAKSAGTKDKRHNSEWNAKHSWSEAVGWSSALAAGWIVCQTLCLHKRFFDRDIKETLKSKLFNYTGVSHVLLQLSNLQPKYILPVINSASGSVGHSSEESDWQDSDSQWNAQKPFGPITVEEELKNVADEFANTHKIIIGEYESHRGIKALEEKRYKDALMHFAAGAKMSSPGSMFNLGLCYELGLGTVADQSEAAKHYNDAAAYDHADALYNLGVFYAQGRGGLPVNIDTARSYFSKAAKLGQTQAERALNLEKAGEMKKNSNIAIVPDTCLKDIDLGNIKTNYSDVKLTDYAPNTNTDHTLSANPIKSMREAIEHNDEKIEDATQIFLDFLGLKESLSSNQVPIITH